MKPVELSVVINRPLEGNVKNVEVRVRSSDCGVGRRGQKGAIDRGA